MKIGKDEKLHIRDTANHAEVTINFSQTKHTEIVFEKQSVMSNKNMLGRAVFGGVLFGDVGAVVGAMTGMGEKSKKKIVAVFALDYTDKNDNIQRILFVETEDTIGLFAFQKKLCKAAGMHFSVQPKAQPVEL
jgi:hypothetical protein